MLPFIFLAVLVVYNTAAATREKMKLQATADATTYSASVLTARTLNYLSYTNRAMAANEASIATLASVQTSMAAGLLVLTEPLSPLAGLRPGVDHIEIAKPWEGWEVAERLRRSPQAMRPIRLAGRRQAERFRASKVLVAVAREALR